MSSSKKRRAEAPPRSQPPKNNKKRRKPNAPDDDSLDVELGLNLLFNRMDNQLLGDYLAQKLTRFGTDLSPVEISDLTISGLFEDACLINFVLTAFVQPTQSRTQHHGRSQGPWRSFLISWKKLPKSRRR
jgi:protein CMS1